MSAVRHLCVMIDEVRLNQEGQAFDNYVSLWYKSVLGIKISSTDQISIHFLKKLLKVFAQYFHALQ